MELQERDDLIPDNNNADNQRVTFDEILRHLGEFGRMQKIVYFMFAIPTTASAMILHGWTFVGAEVPHRCRLPSEVDQDDVPFSPNITGWSVDSCSKTFDNVTTDCQDGWVYDRSQVGDSVTSDWDLVCDKEWQRASIGSSPMWGYLIGAHFFGILADKIGRKKTFLLSNFLMMFGGVLTSTAPELYSFMTARAITGFAVSGIEAVCAIMNVELVGPSKRDIAGIISWYFETLGLLIALLLAYLYRDDWKILQALYSVPAAIFLFYICVPWAESVRWLIAESKNEEARKIIRKTVRYNGVQEVPEDLLRAMERTVAEEERNERNRKSLWRDLIGYNLFCLPSIRYKTFILMLLWLTVCSLYYVLLLDQSELSDNKYLGFLITAGVQLPGYVTAYFAIRNKSLGRKWSLVIFMIITGLALCTHPFVPKDYREARIALSIIGRFAANCSYTILNLYSYELFPTVVRGVGNGVCVTVSRIGTILTPYILLLGPLSPVIFGGFAFISGIFASLLPETREKDLPEQLQDGEEEQWRITLPF